MCDRGRKNNNLFSTFSTAVQNRIFPTAFAHVSVVSEVKTGVVKCESVMVNGWIRQQGHTHTKLMDFSVSYLQPSMYIKE